MATPKDIALQLLTAMTAKNKAETLALMADDAVLFDPHYPTPLMAGKAAISEGIDFAFGMLKQPGWTVLRSWENRDSVVLEVDTHHEMMNGFMVTPKQVFIVDTKDGKITSWQSFVPYPPPA
jgi:ketosteroid isomerase-like protein